MPAGTVTLGTEAPRGGVVTTRSSVLLPSVVGVGVVVEIGALHGIDILLRLKTQES